MELKNFFAQDEAGNILSEATCYLYERGTENLVIGLLKANGTALTNPFSTNAQGLIQFSAPNGLFDLRVVKGTRDSRLRVQCLDVKESVGEAEAAAYQAELAADAAGLSSGVKDDIAQGLATTVSGENFPVLSPSPDEYVILYKNNGGTEKELRRYPSSSAVIRSADYSSEVKSRILASMLDSTSVVAHARGTYTNGSAQAVSAVIFGWSSPFRHNGNPFNVVQFTAKAAAPNTKLIVEVLSENLKVLAHGYAYAGTGNGVLTVVLDRMVTELANGQIGYISYSHDLKSLGVGHPAGGAYDVTDVDPNVYREKYFYGGVWQNTSEAAIGSYRIQFRLLSTAAQTRNLANELSAINAKLPVIPAKNLSNKIVGASMPYVVWNHVLGDAETEGDSSYTNPKIAGFYCQSIEPTLFNAIAGRVWAVDAAASIEWRVWIRDTSGTFNMASEAPSASGTIAAGSFPTSSTLYTLQLPNRLIADTGKWVFVMFRASNDSNIAVRRWLYNAAIVPARNGLPFSSVAGWNNNLSFGTVASGFGLVPPKLLLESEEGRLKAAPSAAATPYSGANSGLAAATVQAAIDELANSALEIVMPPFIYGVEGKECNVYLDNLHLADASDYNHDVTSSGGVTAGTQQNERFTWIPTGAMAAGTLTVAVHDKRTGKLLTVKTAQQRAAPASAGTGLTKKVLVLGDSLISSGKITQALLDIAETDPMKIELLGTLGAGLNKHEGRGGWTVDSYTSSGIVNYRFTVSGMVDSPSINAAEYSHNGAVYRVQEAALVGGAGTITCSVVSGGAPLSSGTLTKTNGAAGDASIAFSASATLSGNPFWFSGAVNFAQYLSTNGIAVPHWVIPGLGINDVFSLTTDAAVTAAADVALIKMDKLIASIKAADANVRVGLMIPPPPSSDQDSFGANYFTGQTRWRFKRNILIWARQMIAKYSGQEANRIYLIPTNTVLDTINNMSRAAAAPVNSRRLAITVSRQNNGVHPGDPGYQQEGDTISAFLKCNA